MQDSLLLFEQLIANTVLYQPPKGLRHICGHDNYDTKGSAGGGAKGTRRLCSAFEAKFDTHNIIIMQKLRYRQSRIVSVSGW